MKKSLKHLSFLLGLALLLSLSAEQAQGDNAIDAMLEKIQRLAVQIEQNERTILKTQVERQECQDEFDSSQALREAYEDLTRDLHAQEARNRELESKPPYLPTMFSCLRLLQTSKRVEFYGEVGRAYDLMRGLIRCYSLRGEIGNRLKSQGIDIKVGEGGLRRRFDDLDALERELKRRDVGLLNAERDRIDRALKDLGAERERMMEQMSELDRQLARLHRLREQSEVAERAEEPPERGQPSRERATSVTVVRAGTGKLEWIKPNARDLQQGLKIQEYFGDEVGLSIACENVETEGLCTLEFTVEGRGRCLCYSNVPKGGGTVIYTHVPLPVGTFTVKVRVLEVPGISPLEVRLTRRPYDEQLNRRKLDEALAKVDEGREKLRSAASAALVRNYRNSLCGAYAGAAAAFNQLGRHQEALRACQDGLQCAGQAPNPADVQWNRLYEQQAIAALYLYDAALLEQAVGGMVWGWGLERPFESSGSGRSLQARRLARLAEELVIFGQDPSKAWAIYRKALALYPSEALPATSNLLRIGPR